ncbi:MAG: hypothetical protein GY913_05730 [Proteobacteria bacterium]|nr:hypothetical protein [Pseudomonadota bacterium]MCP4916404.1 hypothetical protein [Pseudomonadota bacterium]
MLIALLACTAPETVDSADSSVDSQVAWTEDCLGLDEATAFACVEEVFWDALMHDVELDQRELAYDRISGVIDAHPEPADTLGLGRRHFQRGQLAMALAIENGAQAYIGTVIPDIDRAMELDPDNPIIPTWKDSMLIAGAHLLGNDAELEQALEQAWENVELFPVGNVLSISGTTIGLPLSTGAPQKTVELLDEWECPLDRGFAMCEGNTDRAPWSEPGLAFHFGEAYARVGRLETAQEYMDASVAAGEGWPQLATAQAAADDIEGFAAKFEALGEDGSGFDIVYANSSVGCQFCHSP